MYLITNFLYISIICTSFNFIGANYTIPDIILEAFDPKGFIAYLPDSPGIQEFAFHAKINKPIGLGEPGDFGKDVNTASEGVWKYYNSEIELHLNDVINYWVFVQYGHLGYRKDSLSWTVKKLKKSTEIDIVCLISETLRSGEKRTCSGATLLNEQFTNHGLTSNQWIQQQYIPNSGPDFEFVQYTKDTSVTQVLENVLVIKPKIEINEENLRKPFDLKDGCTKIKSGKDCSFNNKNIYGPPITSGQIISNLQFTYGKIEIKAQLPKGNWIYPQIYLQDVTNPLNKIWIAYARGNDNLISAYNIIDDIGNKLLFAGPVMNSSEPQRSVYLVSKRFSESVSNKPHVFILDWKKYKMTFYVDGEEFGSINKTVIEHIYPNINKFSLVLGVGVGGINDFPNDYKTNGKLKPWTNSAFHQVKHFYYDRENWEPTWVSPELKVYYIKITAL